MIQHMTNYLKMVRCQAKTRVDDRVIESPGLTCLRCGEPNADAGGSDSYVCDTCKVLFIFKPKEVA